MITRRCSLTATWDIILQQVPRNAVPALKWGNVKANEANYRIYRLRQNKQGRERFFTAVQVEDGRILSWKADKNARTVLPKYGDPPQTQRCLTGTLSQY